MAETFAVPQPRIDPYASEGAVLTPQPSYSIHGSLGQGGGVGPGLRIGFSSRRFGDDVRWRGIVYHEEEALAHPYPLADGAEPPDELFPVVWDRDIGSVAERSGRFTTHMTLEPRKAGTAVG